MRLVLLPAAPRAPDATRRLQLDPIRGDCYCSYLFACITAINNRCFGRIPTTSCQLSTLRPVEASVSAESADPLTAVKHTEVAEIARCVRRSRAHKLGLEDQVRGVGSGSDGWPCARRTCRAGPRLELVQAGCRS
jgi:hypothetical protein